MRPRNRWALTLMVLAGALLVTVGNWGIYRGGEVRAQIATPFPSSEFKCYVINHGDAPDTIPPGTVPTVSLRDQFSEVAVEHVVREPQLLCAPAQKTPIVDGVPQVPTPPGSEFQINGPHLKCYNITPSGPPTRDTVTLFDQFHPNGDEGVKVQTAQLLCTLACKDGSTSFPICLGETPEPE